MYILYLKSVHIIFVVSWMAGLFYSVRLFIYHTEANAKPEPDRGILQRQFAIIERRLWNIITVPAMILTVISGIWMMMAMQLYREPWMLVKLGFVVGLLVYHQACQHIMVNLRKGIFTWTSTQLRLWNELATILLVGIVFAVVLKSAVDWIWGLLGLIVFSIVIMAAVKVYKYYRMKDGEPVD